MIGKPAPLPPNKTLFRSLELVQTFVTPLGKVSGFQHINTVISYQSSRALCVWALYVPVRPFVRPSPTSLPDTIADSTGALAVSPPQLLRQSHIRITNANVCKFISIQDKQKKEGSAAINSGTCKMPLLKKERKEYPLWLQNLNHPHQRHAVRLFPGGAEKERRKRNTPRSQLHPYSCICEESPKQTAPPALNQNRNTEKRSR